MKLIDLRHSGQRCFLIIAVIIIGLWAGGDEWIKALEYHRYQIAEGEIWRLLTGHIVHTNTAHMLLNLSSLLFIGLLFGTLLNGLTWALAFIFCSLSVSACYWFISPEHIIYVGLSAALYGVIIIGALQDLKYNKLIAGGLLVIVTGRVIWQQFDGASESLAEMVESRVAIESHLYGISAGYIFALGHYCTRLLKHHSDKDAADTL